MKRLWYVVVMISVVPWYVVSMDDPYESRFKLDQQIESTQRAYDKKIKKASTQEEKDRLAIERDRAVQKIKDLAVLGKKVADLGNVTGMRAYFLAMLDQLNRERLAHDLTPIPALVISSIIGYAESIEPITSKIQNWLSIRELPIRHELSAFDISPRGTYLWTKKNNRSPAIYLYRMSDWEQVGKTLHDGVALSFSHDDRYFWVKDSEHRLRWYQASDLTQIGEPIEQVESAQFTVDGTYMGVLYKDALGQRSFALYTTADGTPLGESFHAVDRVIFNKNSSRLLIQYLDGNTHVYGMPDGKKRGKVFTDVVRSDFSPDGRYLYIQSKKVYNKSLKNILAIYDVLHMKKSKIKLKDVETIHFTSDDAYAWIVFKDGLVRVYNTNNWQPVGDDINGLKRIRVSKNGQFLWGSVGTSMVVYRIVDNVREKEMVVDATVSVSPQGHYKLIKKDDDISVWSTKDEQQVPLLLKNVSSYGFSLDEKYMIVQVHQLEAGDLVSTALMYRLSDGQLVGSIPGFLTAFRFDPHDTYCYYLNQHKLYSFNLAIYERLQQLSPDLLTLIAYIYERSENNNNAALNADERLMLEDAPAWLANRVRANILSIDEQQSVEMVVSKKIDTINDDQFESIKLLENPQVRQLMPHVSHELKKKYDALRARWATKE